MTVVTADRRGLQPTRSDLKQFPGRLQCERSEARLQKTTAATGRPPARRRLDERQLSLSVSLPGRAAGSIASDVF